MSDLTIIPNHLNSPPEACGKDPPKATAKNPNPIDDCHMVLPLVISGKENDTPHPLRFDRQGDQFVLSNQNSREDLTWFSSYGDVKDLLKTVKLMETVMRNFENAGTEESYGILITLAQYIVSGKIQIRELPYQPEIIGPDFDKEELAIYLLEVFTHNNDSAIAKLIGTFALFRADSEITAEASERVLWVQDILALRPAYTKFRHHFVNSKEVRARGENVSEQRLDAIIKTLSFCRKVLIRYWQKQPLPFQKEFFAAAMAYERIHPKAEQVKSEQGFCDALADALGELSGKGFNRAQFLQDCPNAERYLNRDGEVNWRENLRDLLIGEEALHDMEGLLKKEVSQSSMSVDWLDDRSRFDDIFKIFASFVTLKNPAKGKTAPTLKFDSLGFSISLQLMLDGHLVHRREFLIAALGVLRIWLAGKSAPPPARLLWGGQFRAIAWDLGKGGDEAIEHLVDSLERQLRVSQQRSTRLLPLVEGLSCLAGVGGMALAESDWGFGGQSDVLGYGAAGLTGAGCSALLGHYLWPKVATVRNAYAWDGWTGAAGGVVGIGIRWLGNHFSAPPGDPTKFPVDEYGD